MKRSSEYEFSAKTKAKAYVRSGQKCERCGLPFHAKNKAEYNHHISVFELEGDPERARSLDNCEVLGSACCHPKETARQQSEVFPKARREDKRRANIARPKRRINPRAVRQCDVPISEKMDWRSRKEARQNGGGDDA